ncbi:hypothetical protein [Bacillus inaquosorum]|uniref:hypothetical protein n=1 Tax=Bacillus inaquosorum TaxID=483913 RepID=UPI00227F9ED9|nr:hypothetical protein [Bacillus inaquosorum]MCY7943838.1 hypothetical protein [Bacillus inaquosorum]MCY8997948.1 hypothetical protein [Bacillus inaquosorum]
MSIIKSVKIKKGSIDMYLSIIILASMLLWGAVIHELSKASKKQSTRKIVSLTSLGSLSTLVITISLFQNFPF